MPCRGQPRPRACVMSGVWGVAAVLAAAAARPGATQERSVETEHFAIYTEANATERQAERVGKLAERAFGRVTGDLGHIPTERIGVLVYGQPAGFIEQGAPVHAVGLVQTPHNLIRIDLWRSQDELYTVVAHEVAHVVLARALRSDLDKCPRWFNEGVATWVSQIWSLDDDARAQDLVAAGHAVAPDALDTKFSASSRQEIGEAYLQSAAMVEYLTRVGGARAIPRVIEALRREPDFDAALRQIAGLTQDELYDRWFRELGGRRRWPRWANIGADALFFAAVAILCAAVAARVWRRRRQWHLEHADEGSLTPEEIERAREIEDSHDSDDRTIN